MSKIRFHSIEGGGVKRCDGTTCDLCLQSLAYWQHAEVLLSIMLRLGHDVRTAIWCSQVRDANRGARPMLTCPPLGTDGASRQAWRNYWDGRKNIVMPPGSTTTQVKRASKAAQTQSALMMGRAWGKGPGHAKSVGTPSTRLVPVYFADLADMAQSHDRGTDAKGTPSRRRPYKVNRQWARSPKR